MYIIEVYGNKNKNKKERKRPFVKICQRKGSHWSASSDERGGERAVYYSIIYRITGVCVLLAKKKDENRRQFLQYSILNDDTITVVDLMLEDLCHPSAEFVALFVPVDVEIFHFDLFVTGACSGAGQGKAAFLRFIFAFFGKDHGVEHGNV